MNEDRVRAYYEPSFGATTNCAQLLHKLHAMFDQLEGAFPGEFKGVRPAVAGPPALTRYDSDSDEEEHGTDDRKDSRQDQALKLMQNQETGWMLISQIAWRDVCEEVITKKELKKRLQGASNWPGAAGLRGGSWHASAVLRALSYWMELFAERASEACRGWSKNSVYQLIAHGRELFEAALKTPDILAFISHQVQDLDFPEILTAVETTAGKQD